MTKVTVVLISHKTSFEPQSKEDARPKLQIEIYPSLVAAYRDVAQAQEAAGESWDETGGMNFDVIAVGEELDDGRIAYISPENFFQQGEAEAFLTSQPEEPTEQENAQ